MKLISRLFFAGAAALAVLLAVANRDRIVVSLDPLPFEIEAPLYAILLAVLFAGVILGGTAGWVSGLKWRRIVRRQRRQIASLEKTHNTVLPSTSGVPGSRTASRTPSLATSLTSPAIPDDPGVRSASTAGQG